VSERTGYPSHMLDPKLDLEADLGIDSIKRIEIVGAVRDKLRLAVKGQPANGLLEELAAVKTLSGMAALIEARIKDANIKDANGTHVAKGPSGAPPASIRRYVVEVAPVPAPLPGGASLEGKWFAITPDRHGVAPKLAELLERHGARARLLESGDKV